MTEPCYSPSPEALAAALSQVGVTWIEEHLVTHEGRVAVASELLAIASMVEARRDEES